MKLLSTSIAMLLLWAAAAHAQEDSGTPAPDPSPPPPVTQEEALPQDPNAPIIVGKEEPPLPGPPVETQPNCECCGKYWDQSPTRIEAVVARGGAKELVRYESVPCMLRDTAKEGSALVRFAIVDYTTAGSQKELMLDGSEAFYVYDARPLPGSSAPYIAAFVDENKAQGALSWLDGKATLSYGELLKRYQADEAAKIATDDSDLPIDAVIPPGEDYYVCACAGGCCDHIRSDVEGVCPDCGLELVRRSEKLRLQRERAQTAKGIKQDAVKQAK